MRLLAASVLRPDSNCVDVGANVGDLLGVFVQLAPAGRHIAFEPVPALAADLALRFPQAEIRRVAASNRRGTADFFVHKTLPSRSGLRRAGYADRELERLSVPVEDLDSSLPRDYVPHLVKIDVEGAEHLVLRGARETLRAHRPLLIFEHQASTAADYGSGPEEMFELITEELGFRIFDLDGRGPYSHTSFGDAYDRGTRWNYFATAS